MKRSCQTTRFLAFALALVLAVPSAGSAKAEFVGSGDAVCSLDLGLRVTLRVDGGSVRSALEFSGRTLASLTLCPQEAVRWGVPVVMLVTEFQNARTDRLLASRGNTGVR
jgi:hypothetical protein